MRSPWNSLSFGCRCSSWLTYITSGFTFTSVQASPCRSLVYQSHRLSVQLPACIYSNAASFLNSLDLTSRTQPFRMMDIPNTAGPTAPALLVDKSDIPCRASVSRSSVVCHNQCSSILDALICKPNGRPGNRKPQERALGPIELGLLVTRVQGKVRVALVAGWLG